MMVSLDRGFKDALRESLLDDVEHELTGGQNSLVLQAIQRSHETLRSVGATEDYDVEPVIDALGPVETERTRDSVIVRYGWEHEAAPYFEWGTRPHTVEGQPILSFIWEDAPPEVREQFEDTFPRVFFSSVEVAGIEETAFVRTGIQWLRRDLQA